MMARYRKRPVEVEAVQWFQNGDHPMDGPAEVEGKVVRYFRRPDIPGTEVCRYCIRLMRYHGWIDGPGDGITVCPGDWIIQDAPGEFRTCRAEDFTGTYEPVVEDEPRRFYLQRDVDVTGASGIGRVADGVLWPDGTVSVHWRGKRPSTVQWNHIEDAVAIHGHGGATRIEWVD